MMQTTDGRSVDFPCGPAFEPFLEYCRYKGLSGGRSSGKSHFMIDTAIDDCLRGHIRAACIRETQSSLAESVKQLIEDKIRAKKLDDLFRITKNEIVGPHDSLFVFKGIQSHTSTRIKSLEGFNRALVEEGQDLSKKSIEDLFPTIRTKGSETWVVWNPNKASDPVDEFFRNDDAANDPEILYRHVTYRDNPYLPRESLMDMRRDRRRDPDKYAHVWLGGYLTHSDAQVFKNWTVEAFDTPADAVFYLGADWGFSVDPTVLVRCFIKGRTLFVDREVYKVGCDIDHTPFLFGGMDDKILQKLNPEAFQALTSKNITWPGIPDARKWIITADSARPETISFMKKHGFPRIRPSIKGAGSIEEGVEFLKGYDIVVHPRCTHTIDELTFYRFKTDPKTEEVIPVLADKKNNVIDSLRYSIERLRRAQSRAGVW